MAITFNGPSKLIEVGAADTSLTATQLYSRWKDWVATSTNAKYLEAFDTVGGDPLGSGISITPYFFLVNNWKIRPYAQSYTLTISENLLTDDNSSPFNFPSGGFSIEVVRQFALKTETVDSGGGGGADPWATALPGAYAAGTAGHIVGNVNSTVADAVWDENLASHSTAGSAGAVVQKILATVKNIFSQLF